MREALCRGFKESGWAVDEAADRATADELWAVNPYDLLVLDLGLPDGDGLELLRAGRRKGWRTPVLILTARDGTGDRVTGLDSGADDYLVKPFAFDEFLARCRALARRGPVAQFPVLVMEDLRVDTARRLTTVGGRELTLTAKEFALLSLLLRHSGRAVSKQEILESCWGDEYDGLSNVIEVHIAALRRKLREADSGVQIRSLRQVGYQLTS